MDQLNIADGRESRRDQLRDQLRGVRVAARSQGFLFTFIHSQHTNTFTFTFISHVNLVACLT